MSFVINHPAIKVNLTAMRDVNCAPAAFREHLNIITSLMLFEVFKHYPTKALQVKTPLNIAFKGEAYATEPTFIPILRAGLGMLSGALAVFPNAKVGHIGVQRSTDAKASSYFFKLPRNLALDAPIFILEPMLATGDSALLAMKQLLAKGYTNLTLISLIAAPEALKHLETALPKLPLFLAALDERLNEHKYIEPGLGDAGDRLFGTED